ncbi:MAG: 30S ribosomal protein S16 [Verrucomicrobia bacterium]|nr:30S ribosomal protein S16 [Verrucomicrobiota bacterium]MBU1734697.1 30S ribosomal protein S16 [Verrucomicrobiota bacterium]
MSVKIRCRKTGANNDPCFRIVATDSRSPRDGKYLEILGWYDPKKAKANFHLKLERIAAWKSKGAILSETVRSLVKKAKTVPMATPVSKKAAEPKNAATA